MRKPNLDKKKTITVIMVFCTQEKLDESVAAKLSQFPAPIF